MIDSELALLCSRSRLCFRAVEVTETDLVWKLRRFLVRAAFWAVVLREEDSVGLMFHESGVSV